MSSSSSSTQNQTRTARMATRQHLTNQADQAWVCFVLNEYSDDTDTSAYMVGQNVPLPIKPTASTAVDIKNTATFNDRAMHDNDDPWATEADHRTGWNQNVQERDVSRHVVWNCFARISEPRQRVSLKTCVNFSLGHKDIIAST